MTEITVRLLQDSPDPYTPPAIFGPGACGNFEPLKVRCIRNLLGHSHGVNAGDKKGGARYELLPFDINSNSLGLNPAGLWR